MAELRTWFLVITPAYMHIFFMTEHLQLPFLQYKRYNFQNKGHFKAATRNFPFVLIPAPPVVKSGVDTPTSYLKILMEQACAFELVSLFITASVSIFLLGAAGMNGKWNGFSVKCLAKGLCLTQAEEIVTFCSVNTLLYKIIN